MFRAIFDDNRPDPILRVHLKQKYGLTDETIDRYILAPPAGDTVQQLSQRGFCYDDLIGIPGFYDDENGIVRFRQYYSTDFGIAVHSENGKIVGILFHYTSQDGRSKRDYGWLSTKLQQNGTPSGAPVGWVGKASKYTIYDKTLGKRRPALPNELGKQGTIFITDGFFKAAACNDCYGSRALFSSGYQNVSSITDAIRSHAERIGSPLRVVLTPDANWRNDIGVMMSCLKIIDGIYRDCFPIWIALWNPKQGKQIDRLIRTNQKEGIKPKRISSSFLPYICNWAAVESKKGTKGATNLLDWAEEVYKKIKEWETKL